MKVYACRLYNSVRNFEEYHLLYVRSLSRIEDEADELALEIEYEEDIEVAYDYVYLCKDHELQDGELDTRLSFEYGLPVYKQLIR